MVTIAINHAILFPYPFSRMDVSMNMAAMPTIIRVMIGSENGLITSPSSSPRYSATICQVSTSNPAGAGMFQIAIVTAAMRNSFKNRFFSIYILHMFQSAGSFYRRFLLLKNTKPVTANPIIMTKPTPNVSAIPFMSHTGVRPTYISFHDMMVE